MNLSNRLLACAQYVQPGERVADIGCDHGYLGIHLLRTGVAESVIAADINPGPLDSARRNAEKYGVRERMTFFRTDGLENIPRDFSCMICAGMGADTIISILGNSPWVYDSRRHLILQCQSRRSLLRGYLSHNGYTIARETLAKDGKFLYTVMDVVCTPSAPLSDAECWVSPALLQSGSPLLSEFLKRVLAGLSKTADGLSAVGGEKYENAVTLRDSVASLAPACKEEFP